jgi:hypothetical protein
MIVGAHVAGGTIYLAVASPSTDTPSGLIARQPLLAPVAPSGGDLSQALRDLQDRLMQDLRSAGAQALAVLETRLFANWKYASAFSRVSLVTVLMVSASRVGIPAVIVKTEAAGRATMTLPNKLDTISPNLFGVASAPTYWKAGYSEAFSAAAGMPRGSPS